MKQTTADLKQDAEKWWYELPIEECRRLIEKYHPNDKYTIYVMEVITHKKTTTMKSKPVSEANKYMLGEYPIQDDVWPSRYWNKERTEYYDLSGDGQVEPDLKQINKELLTALEAWQGWAKRTPHIKEEYLPRIFDRTDALIEKAKQLMNVK